MPCSRARSPTFFPASCCFKIPMICSRSICPSLCFVLLFVVFCRHRKTQLSMEQFIDSRSQPPGHTPAALPTPAGILRPRSSRLATHAETFVHLTAVQKHQPLSQML